jgi:cytochrome c5
MAINAAQVGFGAAVLAGVVLAIIGHPGPKDLPIPAAASASASTNAPQAFVLKSVSVELPTSDITFAGGAAADAINANCLSCHSAGMVLTQPNLAKAAWAAEVDKMIHTFKAPIDQRNATAIVDYLSETKGAK